jgi:hypothetical protein
MKRLWAIKSVLALTLSLIVFVCSCFTRLLSDRITLIISKVLLPEGPV